MRKSVFISRDIDETSPFLDLEIDVFAASQIEVSLNKDQVSIDSFQWIFFSSKNSVKWAIQQSLDLSKIKIGAIGKPTAEYVEKTFGRVDFIGDDSKSVEEISADFDSIVEADEQVLFPISSRSKKTILKNFHHKNEVLIAYQVEYDPILFDIDFDYLIFTSPSNFTSFFSANSIKEDAQIIAIGETTKSEIQKYLNIPIFTPIEKTEKAIYELLKELIMGADPNC